MNKPGRPRAFDADEVLERAMRVFWQKGYEGTSLPELTRAMGINRPSLYAAFGNKQRLFEKAVERYAAGPASYVARALEAATARDVAEGMLYGAVDVLTNPKNPRGCLAVQGALTGGTAAATVRKGLAERRGKTEADLRRRFHRAVREGDLPRGADPAALARYVATVVHGMAVQAAGGANRRDLRSIAETALRAWPK
jgi:AcrR family transcriptional regulator